MWWLVDQEMHLGRQGCTDDARFFVLVGTHPIQSPASAQATDHGRRLILCTNRMECGMLHADEHD